MRSGRKDPGSNPGGAIFEMIIRKLKIAQLARILVNRGSIDKEEYFSFILMPGLLKYSLEEIAYKKSHLLNSRIDYVRRAMTKIFYQQGFLNRIEYDYCNNLLTYAKNHSLISILRSK